MRVLEWLVVLIAIGAVYAAIQQIKATTSEDPFLFLRLFTTARSRCRPSYRCSRSSPLMAIGLGFDAVNGEYNRRTLSRILSQPIYRDALAARQIPRRARHAGDRLVTLWLLIIGLGLLCSACRRAARRSPAASPSSSSRSPMAASGSRSRMLFSVIFRSAATAALVALGLWLFLTVLWPVLAKARSPKPSYRWIPATPRSGLQTPGNS